MIVSFSAIVAKRSGDPGTAVSEIAVRQSAQDFAKSDYERGQELIKPGYITKQIFEQRRDSAIGPL